MLGKVFTGDSPSRMRYGLGKLGGCEGRSYETQV